MSALGLVAAVGLLATGESDTVEPSPPKHLDGHGALDRQSLLMHVETVRLLKKPAACEARGYDAGPGGKRLPNRAAMRSWSRGGAFWTSGIGAWR